MAEPEKIDLEILSWKDFCEAKPILTKGVPSSVPGAYLKCARIQDEHAFMLEGLKYDFDTGERTPVRIKVGEGEFIDVLEAMMAQVSIARRGGGKLTTTPCVDTKPGTRFETRVDCEKGKKWVCDGAYAFKIQKTQYRSKSPYSIIECYLDGFDRVLEEAFDTQGWRAS